MEELLNKINKGKIVLISKETGVNNLPWIKHSQFPGVYLRHFVTGQDTEGKFSCHMVKVESGCELGKHVHEGKWELHEVIQGSGKCILGEKQIDYQSGISTVIPADVPHRVIAEKEGLCLLAKFIPALL